MSDRSIPVHETSPGSFTVQFPKNTMTGKFEREEAVRQAKEEAWDELVDIVFPLYEAAEDVLLNGADRQVLLEPLAAVGRQTNPYRGGSDE